MIYAFVIFFSSFSFSNKQQSALCHVYQTPPSIGTWVLFLDFLILNINSFNSFKKLCFALRSGSSDSFLPTTFVPKSVWWLLCTASHAKYLGFRGDCYFYLGLPLLNLRREFVVVRSDAWSFTPSLIWLYFLIAAIWQFWAQLTDTGTVASTPHLAHVIFYCQECHHWQIYSAYCTVTRTGINVCCLFEYSIYYFNFSFSYLIRNDLLSAGPGRDWFPGHLDLRGWQSAGPYSWWCLWGFCREQMNNASLQLWERAYAFWN